MAVACPHETARGTLRTATTSVRVAASRAAALVVLLLAPHWTALLRLEGLLECSPYLVRHPWQAVRSAVLSFAISVLCAMRRAVDMTPPGHSLWLAGQLTDGRLWEGFLLSMDGERESPGEGDLVLQGPLAVTPPGEGRHHHPARFVALPGSQIALAHGFYTVPRPRSGVPEPAARPEASDLPAVLPAPSTPPEPQASPPTEPSPERPPRAASTDRQRVNHRPRDRSPRPVPEVSSSVQRAWGPSPRPAHACESGK